MLRYQVLTLASVDSCAGFTQHSRRFTPTSLHFTPFLAKWTPCLWGSAVDTGAVGRSGPINWRDRRRRMLHATHWQIVVAEMGSFRSIAHRVYYSAGAPAVHLLNSPRRNLE
ncbi:MAG: hypothetical protein AB7S36_02335, partial [Planctomycetota bacterium]